MWNYSCEGVKGHQSGHSGREKTVVNEKRSNGGPRIPSGGVQRLGAPTHFFGLLGLPKIVVERRNVGMQMRK